MTAEKGDIEAERLLLDRGADVNTKDVNGLTTLTVDAIPRLSPSLGEINAHGGTPDRPGQQRPKPGPIPKRHTLQSRVKIRSAGRQRPDMEAGENMPRESIHRSAAERQAEYRERQRQQQSRVFLWARGDSPTSVSYLSEV